MKKKILTKVLLFFLLALLLYYTAGAVYFAIREGRDVISSASPFFILALVVAYLLYLAFRSTRLSPDALAKIEKLYAPYLKNAFLDNPAARRRLLTLLSVADSEKPARVAAAFLSLEKYAKCDWDMATLLFFAARATAKAGDSLFAVRLYRRAIGERDDFASAWSNLGLLYQLDRDYPAAQDCLQRALALEPDEPLRHHNLATLHLLAGRTKEASAAAKQAVARNPRLADAYLVLALCAATDKNKSEANRYARKCVELGGNESEIDRLVSALLRGERDVLIPAERTAPEAKTKKKAKK